MTAVEIDLSINHMSNCLITDWTKTANAALEYD